MADYQDEDSYRRDYRPGHSQKHPIPTVKQYRDFKDQQKASLSAQHSGDDASVSGRSSHGEGLQRWFTDSKNSENKPQQEPVSGESADASQQNQRSDIQQEDKEDTSQTTAAEQDPKARRKQMKNRDVDQAEREVTDPVTHLPVVIRDFSDADLKEAANHDNDEGDMGRGDGSPKNDVGENKLGHQYKSSTETGKKVHQSMQRSFPAPSYQIAKHELAEVYSRSVTFGLLTLIPIGCLALASGAFISSASLSNTARYVSHSVAVMVIVATGMGVSKLTSGWVSQKAKSTWDDAVWEAQRLQEKHDMYVPEPESTKWLNKLFGSIWPLVNPDLFASLVDTLEDVMQASLPHMVRMVSIEDLGQGSEPLRFLGFKWLPAGAAAKAVSEEGDPTKHDEAAKKQTSEEEKNEKEEERGLEAEEGEFVNLEVAFAYRSSDKVRKIKDREKNAHLYLAFFLPGNLKLPVWVELKGLVGSVRMRLQLTPDPPFIALATITFLGQPKVDIACTPLVKRGLNIMDVPLISNFVQSAVDAAVNQYVAPKSLTLDIQSMISGDDFKHDTRARGIVVVRIHRAFDFKASDLRIPGIRKGSSDPYVSVGWAKFGKPLFSTRVLVDEMEPYWEEVAFLTVGPEELDAHESLRLQLWDSDRTSADDDLGRIEVDLKSLMRDKRSKGDYWNRVDTFEAMNAGEKMPGKLEWSVGYFTKARLLDSQVAYKAPKDHIRTVEQLRQDSYQTSRQKLREANRNTSSEADQLMEDDFQNICTDLITSSVPVSSFPSGILSVQIHQIQGLQLEKQRRARDPDGGEATEAEEEDGEGLPDSYCTIIINHQKVYKTRTKPKNSKPFFNAVTERFVRDWRTTQIIVSVRDARVHEDDALLGEVLINLGDMLHKHGTSRINDFFPLSGGIGYGRVRVSLVFRSVQMQPTNLELGWDWGTVEVAPEITSADDLPPELQGCRIKARTQLGKGRLHANRSATKEADGNKAVWKSHKDRPIRVPVRKRFAASLVFEFRSSRLLLPDQSSAFAILWLYKIPDEEDISLTLPVFRGDLKRAEVNVLPESEMGEKVGSINVKVRFWGGLGRWHGHLAKGDPDIANVMECLVAARDNGLDFPNGLVGDAEWLAKRREERRHAGEGGPKGDDDSDDDDDQSESGSSDSDSDDDDDEPTTAISDKADAAQGKKEQAEADKENSGGIIDEIKGYKRNQSQLHRRHRGIMQWKGPRTINWFKNKVERTAHRVSAQFEHQNREPDVETEV